MTSGKIQPAPGNWSAFGRSDAGLVRDNNEDRFYLDAEAGFFFVVDGMGGHRGGEIAAEIASSTIRERLERKSGHIKDRIIEAITLANNNIFRHAAEYPEFAGMACVVTVAVVEADMVTVGHVGDSRLYLLGKEGIEKITRDHSPIGTLEDNYKISEIEAMSHPARNQVSRDVGSRELDEVEMDFVDIFEFRMPADGLLLLCSDGLTDLVTSHQLLSLYLEYESDLCFYVDELIRKALEAGGHDNITVVAATNAPGRRIEPDLMKTQEFTRPFITGEF